MRVVTAAVLPAIIGLMTLPTASATAASEPQTFEATGPWAVDYADQSCRLARNFANGDKEVTLSFERFLPGPSLRLGLTGEAIRIRQRTQQLKFRYGPGGREQEGRVLFGRLLDGRKAYLVTPASLLAAFPEFDLAESADPQVFSWQIEEELSAARRIDAVMLDARSGPDAIFKLGDMEAPVKALQACIADLISSWGLDMDRMLTATRLAEPTNDPRSWMRSSDYPADMLAKRRTGVVGFRLIVDENGLVKRCFVDVDQPGPFETATCEAVSKRARFTPALDGEGKPMPALYTCSVRFVL